MWGVFSSIAELSPHTPSVSMSMQAGGGDVERRRKEQRDKHDALMVHIIFFYMITLFCCAFVWGEGF